MHSFSIPGTKLGQLACLLEQRDPRARYSHENKSLDQALIWEPFQQRSSDLNSQFKLRCYDCLIHYRLSVPHLEYKTR